MPGISGGFGGPQFDDATRTVKIPATRWWRRLLAFVGPAYMVSVGYVDPGNWATDIAGGSQFGYTLLWILVVSSAMAVLLQVLSARLGLVTGHNLAQACRDEYPPLVRYVLFVLTEITIAATDLAEALGSAVALNLLFGIPILWAVLITASDVLLLLVIQRFGIRKMEAVIVMLIATIGICFIIEIFLSRPEWAGVAAGLRPGPLTKEQLYVAIGILGATVMPHNLYLHSSLVQSRDVARSRIGVAQACRFNLIDSAIAMNLALLVNAAILITAAAAFGSRGIQVTELQQAHGLLEGLLGSHVAPVAFAIALLASGQSSTVTGTLAGQITMEGFMRFRMRPWLRRLSTRLLAIVPAVVVILMVGDSGVYRLLILSQVVLSLHLPFAIVPLIKFTGSGQKMGPFANGTAVQVLAWVVAAAVVGVNVWLVYGQILDWMTVAGPYGWLVAAAMILVAAPLAALLVWMAARREKAAAPVPTVSPDQIVAAAEIGGKHFRRIGVALEATQTDAMTLAEAIPLAEAHGAELILMHVVEGVGGQWFGPQTGDAESRQDERYFEGLAERLRQNLVGRVAAVRHAIGYGSMPQGLVRLAKAEKVDLLVMGGHGHKALGDILHGETIQHVRHGLDIPVLAVKKKK
jgi:manganese transport protein